MIGWVPSNRSVGLLQGKNSALVRVAGHVQVLRNERARVEQHRDVLPVALVQVRVRLVAGERSAGHQARADDGRVVVVRVEEPVLQSEQAAGYAGIDGTGRPGSGAHGAGGVEVDLRRVPGVEQRGVGQPVVRRADVDRLAVLERAELAVAVAERGRVAQIVRRAAADRVQLCERRDRGADRRSRRRHPAQGRPAGGGRVEIVQDGTHGHRPEAVGDGRLDRGLVAQGEPGDRGRGGLHDWRLTVVRAPPGEGKYRRARQDVRAQGERCRATGRTGGRNSGAGGPPRAQVGLEPRRRLGADSERPTRPAIP